MSDITLQTQKHLVTFCQMIPVHVACWKSVLQDSAKPLQNLANLFEQQRHLDKCNISYIKEFDDIRSTLQYQISNRIEEELVILKELINSLNKSNNDLKNKLLVLERASLKLDWEQESSLIIGSATQPSLSRLLQDGLTFLTYFSKNGKNISDSFKKISFNDEKSIERLKECFSVDLDNRLVTNLVAITQYVDNEKAIP